MTFSNESDAQKVTAFQEEKYLTIGAGDDDEDAKAMARSAGFGVGVVLAG